jgi:5'(3')-deoxyribonucleotidase
MNLNKEELKFLVEVCDKTNKILDKVSKKYNFDRTYFGFVLVSNVYSRDFEKLDEIVLIDDTPKGYCKFCGKKTYFYEDGYYCPECYAKLKTSSKKF